MLFQSKPHKFTWLACVSGMDRKIAQIQPDTELSGQHHSIANVRQKIHLKQLIENKCILRDDLKLLNVMI